MKILEVSYQILKFCDKCATAGDDYEAVATKMTLNENSGVVEEISNTRCSTVGEAHVQKNGLLSDTIFIGTWTF